MGNLSLALIWVRVRIRFAAMADGGGGSWSLSYTGMSSDNVKGLVLALSSSLFIGASFIVKKKGLKKASASGVRAGNIHFAVSFYDNYVHRIIDWCLCYL